MGFVDIHTHILPCLDDGAKDLNTSVCMVSMAEENGTSKVIVTPHFIEGSFDNTTKVVESNFNLLKLNLAYLKDKSNIDLFFGCEAFICPDLPELVKNKAIASLNNTSYVLVELPMMGIPTYTDEVFYHLELYGYKPVLAHPERNSELGGSIELLENLVRHGVFVQLNAGSLLGLHGKTIAKISHNFIKQGLVHFIASDAHSCGGRSPILSKAFKLVEKNYGYEVAHNLFELNGEALLLDGDIKNVRLSKVKKKFFIFGKR